MARASETERFDIVIEMSLPAGRERIDRECVNEASRELLPPPVRDSRA